MSRIISIVSMLAVVAVGFSVFQSRSSSSQPPARPGWTRLLMGRPSGVQPVAAAGALDHGIASEPDTVPVPVWPTPGSAKGEQAATDHRPVFQVTVRSGDTLGELCQGFYGTARPSLVSAVAHYNGLPGPDHIREGQVLRLPPQEDLE